MMHVNSEIIIADTSCLILLTKIDEVDILQKMSESVCITPEVSKEFTILLPDWIKVVAPKDTLSLQILEQDIDKGEASSIILAMETVNSLLVVDDLAARKVAKKLGVSYTGTLGLLLSAKLHGVIPALKPIFHKIASTNFRISEKLLRDILDIAQE